MSACFINHTYMVFDTMIYQYEFPNYDSWFQIRKCCKFTLIMYRYCKLYKWFIDMKYIDEYGFIRACLWKKGFMVFYSFGSTELNV